MVVIKSATYQTRCPFSKNLIKPNNKICLFTEEQFTAFKRILNKELLILFPEEIISLIIEKTNYEKLIGRFGHENVTHWTAKQSIIKLQRHDQYNRKYNGVLLLSEVDTCTAIFQKSGVLSIYAAI